MKFITEPVHIQLCKFCQEECRVTAIVSYMGTTTAASKETYTCKACSMNFILQNNEMIAQNYNIYNDKYDFISMNLLRNETTIHRSFEENPELLTPITVGGLFLDTLPQDIEKLAARLLSLTAFI